MFLLFLCNLRSHPFQIFKERLARFSKTERSMGWHTQYNSVAPGSVDFIADPQTLTHKVNLYASYAERVWQEMERRAEENPR
eukprot:m.102962 g.102962  ORF g.102962 m.102962 type:complete len:82 (-) comp18803_c0_seq2:75-320(-)